MRFLFVLMLVLWPYTAHAQDDGKYPPECRLLANHKAPDDVNYNPGVDVRGKAVVPADINASPMGLDQQTIVVPLTIDLARRLENNSINGLQLDATPGYLEIAPSGRVTYNGQDLTSQVHALCAGNPQETDTPAPAEPDRQTDPDVIESAPVKEIAPKPAAKPVTTPPAPVIEAPKPEPEPVQGELLEGGEYTD
jgi:hypothetical protein